MVIGNHTCKHVIINKLFSEENIESMCCFLIGFSDYSAPIQHTLSYPTDGVYSILVKAMNLWSNVTGYDTDNVTLSVIVQYPVTTFWTFSLLTADEYILPGIVSLGKNLSK